MGDTSGTAQTIGVGLDGGNDGDVVTNAGAIALTGTATALGQMSRSVLRISISDAGGTASSTFTGVAGGAGDDTVVNTGAITLTPTAKPPDRTSP